MRRHVGRVPWPKRGNPTKGGERAQLGLLKGTIGCSDVNSDRIERLRRSSGDEEVGRNHYVQKLCDCNCTKSVYTDARVM